MNYEEIRDYLPQFLFPQNKYELYSELNKFPDNIDSRIYTQDLKENLVIYQGDGIDRFVLINLPDSRIGFGNAIILSNTCDIDINNSRLYDSQITYAPIFNLNKYENRLIKKGINKGRVETHINEIRRQKPTQIFYLPAIPEINFEESMVFFDRVLYINNSFIDRNELNERRIFTLSQYGHYLFILKLSIHFLRMNDKVKRTHNFN